MSKSIEDNNNIIVNEDNDNIIVNEDNDNEDNDNEDNDNEDNDNEDNNDTGNTIVIGFFVKENQENQAENQENQAENQENQAENDEENEEEYEEENDTIFIVLNDGKPSRITFWTYSCPCPSGWTLGFHAVFSITNIDPENIDSIFSKITHYANRHISINIRSLEKGYYEDDVFSFSEYGDDHWYQTGHFYFDESYFSSIDMIKVNKVNFNESIKDEFLAKLFDPDRLEQLSIFCNKDLEYLGRPLISIKDILNGLNL